MNRLESIKKFGCTILSFSSVQLVISDRIQVIILLEADKGCSEPREKFAAASKVKRSLSSISSSLQLFSFIIYNTTRESKSYTFRLMKEDNVIAE